MIRLIPILAILLFVFSSQPAAQCFFDLDVDQVFWESEKSQAYDPFSVATPLQNIRFDLGVRNSQDCLFYITFSPGGLDSFNRDNASGESFSLEEEIKREAVQQYNRTARHRGHALRYQLHPTSQLFSVLKDGFDARFEDDVISGIFRRGESSPRTLTYYISIPAFQVVPPGTYTDIFTVSAYEGTVTAPGNAVQQDTSQVKLSVRVPEIYNLSVESAQTGDKERDFHIEVDDLRLKNVVKFTLIAKTNAPYQLTFEPLHWELLPYQNAQIEGTIPYDLIIDGQSIDLDSQNPIVWPVRPATSHLGDRYQVELVLTDPGEFNPLVKQQFFEQFTFSIISAN